MLSGTVVFEVYYIIYSNNLFFLLRWAKSGAIVLAKVRFLSLKAAHRMR